MKKYLLLFSFFCFSTFSVAQIQDLASLSSGQNIYFSTVYNSDNELYGYFALFYKGKGSKETRLFEYVIMDTNLNTVANKDFEAENTVLFYYPYINFKGELTLIPEMDSEDYNVFNYGKMKYPETQVVNLETNEIAVKQSLCYKEDGTFYDCPENKRVREAYKEFMKERRQSEDGTTYESNVYELESGGYIVSENRFHLTTMGAVRTDHYYSYKKFDENKNLLWEYTYTKDENDRRREKHSVRVLHLSDDFLYLNEKHYDKKDVTNDLVKIDLKTGEVALKKTFENVADHTINTFRYMELLNRIIYNEESYGDLIYFIGFDNDDKGNFTGFARMTIDEKQNTVAIDRFKWTDLQPFIEVDKRGGVGRGYSLFLKDLYIMQDGKVGMLFEKFKLANNVLTGYTVPKATDLVYLITDSEFKVNDVKVLEKAKSKGNTSDYMFSQFLNDKKDVVFFYRNFQKDEETKEKNWNLFINTVIAGDYKQEVIPISSEENLIYPYIAKEGYILLREYNKDQKYNQVRLEKLNY